MARRSNLFLAAGCLLILGSLALLVTSQLRASQAREETAEIVREMREILKLSRRPRAMLSTTWAGTSSGRAGIFILCPPLVIALIAPFIEIIMKYCPHALHAMLETF